MLNAKLMLSTIPLVVLLAFAGRAAANPKSGPIVLNVTDHLKTTDGKDAKFKKSPCKVYKVKLMEGKPYQIDLRSDYFDSVLRIENAEGKEVAFNNDAPPGNTLDARITYTPTATDEYKIIATNAEGSTGEFTLVVFDKTNTGIAGGGPTPFTAKALE